MRAKKLIPLLIFSLLLASSVSAAAADILLGPFLRLDIAGTYARFGFIIDAVLYFMILLGASRIALEKRFEGKAGKAIIVSVGIALTFGIVLWEYRTGFRLSNLWPLAMIIVFFTFAMAFYNFIKGGNCNKAFGLLAFAFLFFFFQGVLPSLSNWFAFHANSNIRLTWAVLNMFAIVALIWGIVELISCMTGGGSSGGGGGGHGPGPGGAGPHTPGAGGNGPGGAGGHGPGTTGADAAHSPGADLSHVGGSPQDMQRMEGVKKIIEKYLPVINTYDENYKKKLKLMKEYIDASSSDPEKAEGILEEIGKIIDSSKMLDENEEKEIEWAIMKTKEQIEVAKQSKDEKRIAELGMVLGILAAIYNFGAKLRGNLKQQKELLEELGEEEEEMINAQGEEVECDYHIVVAKIKGLVVGFTIFYSVISPKTAFGFEDYLVPSFKIFKQIGIRNIDEVYKNYHVPVELDNYQKKILANDAAKRSLRVSCILNEMEDPRKNIGKSAEDFKKKGLSTHPADSMVFQMGVRGYRYATFDYIQPSLEKGKEMVDSMNLMVISYVDEWLKSGIPPETMKYMLNCLYTTWTANGVDPINDPAIVKMNRQLDEMRARGQRVMLIHFEDLVRNNPGPFNTVRLGDFKKFLEDIQKKGKRI